MKDIKRADIKIGASVRITLKKDQRTNKLTEGTVKEILTNSPSHPHGIKVRLVDGQVGRVKELI
ncbi:MAG: YwbE family protein [Chloroflexi bacterium]|nr:YwbE family protein [Chloroflexota bacterium]